jgi:hypothetical protein
MFRFEKGIVSVGDTVLWRGGFGEDPDVPAQIQGIEINTRGSKNGDSVDSAPWSAMRRDNAVITLSNSHWCYGNQISPDPDANNKEVAGEHLDKLMLGKTLEDLIINARSDSPNEPLDGDEVEEMIDNLRDIINRHEGNI